MSHLRPGAAFVHFRATAGALERLTGVAAEVDLRALSPEFNGIDDVVLKGKYSADILDFHTLFLRCPGATSPVSCTQEHLQN